MTNWVHGANVFCQKRENKKKYICLWIFIIFAFLWLNVFAFRQAESGEKDARIVIQMLLSSEQDVSVGISSAKDREQLETQRVDQQCKGNYEKMNLAYPIYANADYLKIGLDHAGSADNSDNLVLIQKVWILYGAKAAELELLTNVEESDGILSMEKSVDGYAIHCSPHGAWLVAELSGLRFCNEYRLWTRWKYFFYALLLCLVMDLAIFAFVWLCFHLDLENRIYGTRLNTSQKILVLSVFLLCVCGAVMIHPFFCPDEGGRQLLTSYMFRTGRLPTGDEPETIMVGWGFSYALRPYLSAMVGAFFMKVASVFLHLEEVLLVMSRMCSILSAVGVCYFCLKIGNALFRYAISSSLFALVVCFFPQVLFLGMYQNNDMLSLMGVSMLLYFLVRGYQTHWRIWECFGLAVGCTVCILSYYSVYPWILATGISCIVACIFQPETRGKYRLIFQRIGMVVSVVLLLSGWFFVRNAMLHNGDFLGIASEAVYRASHANQGWLMHPYQSRYEAGYTFWGFLKENDFGWFRMTIRSMIGFFGHMHYSLPLGMYCLYYACILFLLHVFFRVVKQAEKSLLWKLFMMDLLASNLMVLGLSLYQSYFRDYQPQGRYVITFVLLIGFSAAFGMDQASILLIQGKDAHGRKWSKAETENKKNPAAFGFHLIVMVVWVAFCGEVWFGTMGKTIF